MEFVCEAIQSVLHSVVAHSLLQPLLQPITATALALPVLGWLRSRRQIKALKRKLQAREADISRLQEEAAASLQQVNLLRELSSPEFSIRPLQDESMAQHKREMCGVLNDLLQVEAKVATCMENLERKLTAVRPTSTTFHSICPTAPVGGSQTEDLSALSSEHFNGTAASERLKGTAACEHLECTAAAMESHVTETEGEVGVQDEDLADLPEALRRSIGPICQPGTRIPKPSSNICHFSAAKVKSKKHRHVNRE